MFTGLVEEIGTAERLNRHSGGLELHIRKPSSFDDIKVSDSIAIDGVCLTIINLDSDVMAFDVMQESLKRTNLKYLAKGSKVNLERALEIGQRLGGHFVTGHIDYAAKIRKAEIKKYDAKLEIALPPDYKRYITAKGCIAADGVSLTVAEVLDSSFLVYLIPHTIEKTTLGLKRKGDIVNIEIDILAKIVLKSENEKKSARVDISFLKEHGFV